MFHSSLARYKRHMNELFRLMSMVLVEERIYSNLRATKWNLSEILSLLSCCCKWHAQQPCFTSAYLYRTSWRVRTRRHLDLRTPRKNTGSKLTHSTYIDKTKYIFDAHSERVLFASPGCCKSLISSIPDVTILS
jgi:hypothetical protein